MSSEQALYRTFANQLKKELKSEKDLDATILQPPRLSPGGLNAADKAGIRWALESFDARALNDASAGVRLAFSAATDASRAEVLDGIYRCLRLAYLHTRGMRFADAVRVVQDGIEMRGDSFMESRSVEERTADEVEIRKVARVWLQHL